jgi:hypothetical protein
MRVELALISEETFGKSAKKSHNRYNACEVPGKWKGFIGSQIAQMLTNAVEL